MRGAAGERARQAADAAAEVEDVVVAARSASASSVAEQRVEVLCALAPEALARRRARYGSRLSTKWNGVLAGPFVPEGRACPADGPCFGAETYSARRCSPPSCPRPPPRPSTDLLERLGETFGARATPIEKRRMLVIVNPYATTVSDRLRHLVVHALAARYEVTAFDTQRQGHATELVREAAREGYDVVVAFGGDGTLNEAANGLAGTDVPLTHLPGGATNVFCKMLGIPGEIVDATEHLLRIADDWQPRHGRPRRGSTAATSRSPRASASTPRSSSAVDRKPAPQAPLRRVVLHVVGGADVPAPLPRQPAAGRGRDADGRAS